MIESVTVSESMHINNDPPSYTVSVWKLNEMNALV